MPFGVNLSRRIKSENEQSIKSFAILIKPAGMGLLVRTAEGKPEEAV